MDNEKVVKKGRAPRHKEDDGQTQQTPPPNGVLVVHVTDSTEADSNVIRQARVKLRPSDATQATEIPGGETEDSGDFVASVPPGTWRVVAEAFGKTHTSDPIEVGPKCETDVPVVLPVNLQLTTMAFREGDQSESLRFYPAGSIIVARAEHGLPSDDPVVFEWTVSGGSILETGKSGSGREIHIDTVGVRGPLEIEVTMSERNTAKVSAATTVSVAGATAVPVTGALGVGLRRTTSTVTPDLPLWIVIRNSTDGLAFKNYQRYMDVVLCNVPPDGLFDEFERRKITAKQAGYADLQKRRFLPFTDSDAYRLLKVATESFVMVNCGVAFTNFPPFDQEDLEVLIGRTGVDGLGMDRFERLWKKYLEAVNGTQHKTLPYLALIASKLPEVRLKNQIFAGFPAVGANVTPEPCYGVLAQKLTEPCLVELIWSYWHEEAMLVQTLNAISVRFQNRRSRGNGDPLANMEIDPLRPLNNLLWGYIQDEQHRLTVVRRGYEYDHQYGLRLQGRAVPEMRTADSRSQFLAAFHNLLHLCAIFYQQDDDTTVISDGFPVLNALKEVHLILSQGAHNQFGDLPSTARVEMLMQQWMLARPEFRDFLPTRVMVAYPEPWMDRVDAMKRLQGWSDVNVLHFRDLGVFGEKLLLSIRYGSWVDVHDPDQAKNWLRYWRPEIQGYIHAYRAVTGVDVSTEPVNSTPPSVILQERLSRQPRPRVS